MRPARPHQRERIHQRTSPGLHMKGVEGTQNRLTMRHRRWRIPTPRRPLPSHRVHRRRCPRHRSCRQLPRPGNGSRPLGPAAHASADGLASRSPGSSTSPGPTRVACPHATNRPQEPEPPQQIHPVRPLRRRRPPTSLQTACRNIETATTTTPSPSSNRYGSHTSPVATTAPANPTTSDPRSLGTPPDSITNRKPRPAPSNPPD